MIIKFLQAGNGDCILIQGEGHHVIIDSGEYCAELRDAIRDIMASEESIDLLIRNRGTGTCFTEKLSQ